MKTPLSDNLEWDSHEKKWLPRDRLIELPFDIPILDEHPLRDEETQELLMDLTPSVLQKIADNNNARIKETGDLVPLVIGHTKDNLPEIHQPKIVGFAHKFQVKPFKKGKRAIFCRYLVKKNKLDLVREFPRRSVELWLSRMEIDPISLLGASTPDRDLGLVRFAERGSSYTREIEDNMNPDMNELVQAVLAALKETSEWKLLGQLVEEMKAPEANPEEPSQIPPSAENAPPSQVPPPEAEAGEIEGEEKPAKTEEKPQQMSASTASGNNTYTPNRLQFSAAEMEAIKGRLDVLAAENKALRDGLNTQVKLSRRHQREKDLIRLAEGPEQYNMDVEEELLDGLELSDEQWGKRLDRIKKRYQRSPVGGKRLPLVNTNDMPDEARRAKVERATQIALKTGRTFAEVFDEL